MPSNTKENGFETLIVDTLVNSNGYEQGVTTEYNKQYAIDECTNPVRTVTSTVRTVGGGVIPVKTDRPIPKELMFDCMDEIDRAVAALPAHIGDVVIENLLGTGANVIITANME